MVAAGGERTGRVENKKSSPGFERDRQETRRTWQGLEMLAHGGKKTEVACSWDVFARLGSPGCLKLVNVHVYSTLGPGEFFFFPFCPFCKGVRSAPGVGGDVAWEFQLS